MKYIFEGCDFEGAKLKKVTTEEFMKELEANHPPLRKVKDTKIPTTQWICPICNENFKKKLEIPNFDKIKDFPITSVFLCKGNAMHPEMHQLLLYIDANRKVRGIEEIHFAFSLETPKVVHVE